MIHLLLLLLFLKIRKACTQCNEFLLIKQTSRGSTRTVGKINFSKIDMHQQQTLLMTELLLLPYVKIDLSIIILRNFLGLTMLGSVIVSFHCKLYHLLFLFLDVNGVSVCLYIFILLIWLLSMIVNGVVWSFLNYLLNVLYYVTVSSSSSVCSILNSVFIDAILSCHFHSNSQFFYYQCFSAS